MPGRHPSYSSDVLAALGREHHEDEVIEAPGVGPVDGVVVAGSWQIAVVSRRPPVRPASLVRHLAADVGRYDALLVVVDARTGSTHAAEVAHHLGVLPVPRAVACWRAGTDTSPLAAATRGLLALLRARDGLAED